MYIVTAPFDLDQALAKIAELLALGDSPDHLANLLGLTRDLADVRQGVQPASFKQMLADVGRLQKYIGLQKQTEKLKTDQSMLRFLGSGYKEKQLAKLDGEREKFGSLIAGPKWFYAQPRVRLLSAIRDYGLDHSQQGDAAWGEVDENSLVFPILTLFEQGDLDGTQILIEEIEKPLQAIEPRFLLESFEGHRSISFDFENGVATYYAPTPAPAA